MLCTDHMETTGFGSRRQGSVMGGDDQLGFRVFPPQQTSGKMNGIQGAE